MKRKAEESYYYGAAPRGQTRPIQIPNRSPKDVRRIVSVISKTNRDVLDGEAFASFVERAKGGMQDKFHLERSSAKDDWGILIWQLERELQAYDMDDVFVMADSFVTDMMGREAPQNGFQKVDLLRNYTDVSLDVVKKNSAFYYRYGADFRLQNLCWSADKVLASCDDDLRRKVIDQIREFPPCEVTGPVVFKVMMDLITGRQHNKKRPPHVEATRRVKQEVPRHSET